MRPTRRPLNGQARGRMAQQCNSKPDPRATTAADPSSGKSLDSVNADTRWPRRNSSAISVPISGAPA